MKRRLAIVLAWFAASAGVALGQARIGLHLVDSTGQKVGYVFDYTSAMVFIDGTAYRILADGTGFSTPGYSVSFRTPDCSGTAYLNPPFPSQIFGIANASYTTDRVFHYPSTAPPENFTPPSYRSFGGDGLPGPCTIIVSGPGLFVPAASVPAPTFIPPFRVVETLEVSPAPPVATFNDVPTSHPFFQFIEALSASGITAGCSASPPLYCPDAPVTRGQMAVFLAKALGLF